MVAVVSGSGLGLFGTSASTQGANGNASLGRGGEQVFVNTATGNLVIQSFDESLTARGLDLALVRTYNSQGLLNDDNGDNWRLGVHRRVYALTGTLNTDGSTITKVFGDGAEVVYRYDAALGRYVSTDGDGAHDTLLYDATESGWTWTDESSRARETYDSLGRLAAARDADGNEVTYGYTGAFLTLIVDASGQQTHLDYTGNQLTQVRVVSEGNTQTLTRYAYDGQGRLESVRVDLSPEDNVIADGDVYLTSYTYEGNSRRVASITQTDGSSISFTYLEIDGAWRVHTFTDAENRTTTLDYTLPSGTGSVPPTTVDANPAVLIDTEEQTTSVEYTLDDDALSTTETQQTTVPHPLNTGELSTTDTVITETEHPLNAAQLTQPSMGWAGPEVQATPARTVNDPRIGFDAQGNAIAVWRSESNIYAQRFDRTTGTWGALTVLDTLTANPSISRVAVDSAGNALAVWVQSDGTAASLFASRYDAVTGVWSAATQLDRLDTAVSNAATGLAVAIRGGQAAVAWLQPQPTGGTVNCVWAARLSGGVWSTAVDLDIVAGTAAQPSLALDASGNVTVLWQQSDGTANSIWQSRYSASAGTWSTAATFETSNTAANDPRIVFDAAGNGLAIWREAGNIFARRYTAATNTWSAQVALDNRTQTITAPDLAIDAATGNAVAVWVQNDGVANSVYASRFTAATGTWTTAATIESSAEAVVTTTGTVVASMAGGNIAVAWLQTDGTRNNLWVGRFSGAAWTVQNVESLDTAAAQPSVAVDASGNVSVTWQQVANDNTNMFERRYSATTGTWSAPSVHSVPAVTANDPQIAFDAAGNAVATWRAYNNLYTQSYNRATRTWSALQVIDGANAVVQASNLSVDAAGNAVVAWVQTDGTALSAWAAVRNGATGTWGSATLIETSPLAIVTAAGSIVTSINNGHAAVAALVTDGVNHLAVTRLTASGWTEPVEIDDNDDFAAAQPQIAVDAAGDVFVTWRQQRTGINNATFATRYRVDTDTWSTPVMVDTTTTAANDPQILVANNGNALGVWREGGNVQTFRYNYAGDSFQAIAAPIDNRNNTIALVDLAMDRATGNALAAWVQSDGVANSVYTSFYNATTQTWSTPAVIDGVGNNNAVATTANTLRATMAGGRAAVSWLQTDGTRNRLMVSSYGAGAWSAPLPVETGANVPAQPSIAIDATGIVSVMWQQSDGLHANIMANHFAPGGGAPYYTVQSGDTWASIATLLYGDAGAGPGLQAALGNPTLTAGVQLSGFPAALTVVTTETVTVPPYYLIEAGDTWASIATLLYGTADVAAQLQAQQGNPPLTPGNRLTGLAANFNTTTTTTVTVPPYYIVDADDTWASIATLLYGTAAVADQLSAHYGNVALSTGLRLDQPPASFTVTTTVTVPVAPYYLVQSGQDWDDIALAVYGIDDANAVQALRDQFPAVTLAAGLHLQVPASLSYTPVGAVGTTVYLRTDIEDALGFVSTLEQDTAGRLLAMLAPTMNGERLETRYAYDAAGNVTRIVQDPLGIARTSTMEYDARGNLVLSRDHAGNTVTRTWSDTNQLLTQTQFLVADPDAAGPQLASVPLTARFVYDSEDHLRFSVSADGRVTEHRYNASGERITTLHYRGAFYNLAGLAPEDTLSLDQLTAWAGGQDLTRLTRSDLAYDFRGNVETTTTYGTTSASGAGLGTPSVTRFVYDQRGRLLTRIDARGTGTPADDFTTTYTYDGLGRVENATEWVRAGVQRQVVSLYDDANRTTTVSLYNGLITTSQFNRAGELVSVASGVMGDLSRFGTTTNTYDANGRLRMVTASNGARVFSLYDDAGRLVATVDPDGTFSEFIYDDTSALVKTIQYAVRLDAATRALLVTGDVPQDVPLGTLRDAADGTPAEDRITRSVYDSAGRVIYTIDADGALTQRFYDAAGRLTEDVAFATRVNIAREVDALEVDDVTVTSSSLDRHTRHFYDADGNEIATLDSGGYLVEYLRDPAGFLVQQVAYATQTAAQYWTAGTLEQLRPAANEDDIRSHIFYDAQGRKVGVLDSEGFFTETVYDEAGQVVSITRYDVVVEFIEGTSSFESLRGDALAGVTDPEDAHTSTITYDGVGRVLTETNFEGTVTRYEYDDSGRVTTVTRALNSPADRRITQTRLDEMGRVLQELTAEGYAQITVGMSTEEIAEIWAKHSVTFAYDDAGRRISATARPNDEQTNTTLYFYDEENRQRYEVNARGEVRESVYDAFGQVTSSIAYVNRISTAGLTGGAIVQALTDRLAAAADVTRDARASTTYTRRGQVATTASAENAGGTFEYDAFGANTVRTQRLVGDISLRHEYSFDVRGNLTETVWDPSGLNTSEQRTYDAFGRVISITDARGEITQFEFDRLGRQLAVVDAFGNRSGLSYDGFSRTLASTDRAGATTTFSYDDVARTMTVVSPEGIEVVTTHNRHGQTLRVTQAGRSMQSSYDLNGNLLETFDNLGSFGTTEYDRSGRVFRTTTTSGAVTTIEYDVVNRVVTRTVDSPDDGLQLITRYEYDGEGRVTRIIEPGGRITDTGYDRDGRVTSIIVDPDGLALRTEFIYDLAGRQIETIEGVGSTSTEPRRVVTEFDALGRKVRETIDPMVDEGPDDEHYELDLITEFRYDAAGNLTRKINAEGSSTWSVYDANSQLRFTVDAEGGVSEIEYDAAGRVVFTRRYATDLLDLDTGELPAFGDVLTLDELTPLLTQTDRDRVTRSVFDGDGREVFTINGLGGVTERTYDANGKVTRTRIYSIAIEEGDYGNVESVRQGLELAGNDVDGLAATDRVTWAAYDLRGRATFAVDGLGAVTRSEYDAAGNVVRTTAFATPYDTSLPMTDAALRAWASTPASSSPANRVTRAWFDALDRVRFRQDASGFLTETRRDDNARTESSIGYAGTPGAIDAAATLDDVEQLAAALADVARDHSTRSERDVAGRVTRSYDAANNFEEYGYDALGNRTSLRNKLGAVWTYEYDANRRLVNEISPAVEIMTVERELEYEPRQHFVLEASSETDVIVTHMQYSALGNVTARTEAYGRYEQRTTFYAYDRLGRQVITYLPSANEYFAEGSRLYDYGDLTEGWRIEEENSFRLETFYDALGNAEYHNGFNGQVLRLFDRLGRVTFEIDALYGVTEFRYDSFGNQVQTIRYANSLLENNDELGDITVDNIRDLLAEDPLADRVIDTEYDRQNRAVRVMQPTVLAFEPSTGSGVGQLFNARPTAVTQYDAFGQAVKQSQLVNPLTAEWNDSYNYFDNLGRQVASVDALGYLTTFAYDAFGNQTANLQFSRALAAGSWDANGHAAATPTTSTSDPLGLDREIRWAYDVMNRQVSETRVAVAYSTASGSGVEDHVADAVTTFGYDALGNKTSTTDAIGATTFTLFDVLGRQVAVAAPTRDRGDGTLLTPLVTYKHDAFGNLVQQRVHALGVTDLEDILGTATETFDDRVTLALFDARNRPVQTQDAARVNSFVSYTGRGDIGREWTPSDDYVAGISTPADVTAYEYDELGRQTRAVKAYQAFSSSGEGLGVDEVGTSTYYNTFGEIVRTQADIGPLEFHEYDNSGRVVRSNRDDGVTKVYLYNLAGQVTAEIRSPTRDLRGFDIATAAILQHDIRRTETRYDALGRVVEQRLPDFVPANQDAGLQAIGALLRVDDNVLGPNNPDAVFQITVDAIDYGDPFLTQIERIIINARNGGYRYVPPTTTNPGGGWEQDPNYALVPSRYIHWRAPANFQYDNGTRSLANFEIRPVSSSTYAPLRVVNLPDGELGVDIGALGAGEYVYRLTYNGTASTEPYAIATGTLTIGATASLQDTTAATLAGQNQVATTVVEEVALNAQFRDANFRTGDFDAPNPIDPFVYRRVVSGSQYRYIVDRLATVQDGGGWYLTASGYVLKEDYLPANSRLLQWNAPADPDLGVVMEFAAAGTENWQSLGVESRPGGVYSVALGDYDDGNYEWRISYYSISNPAAGTVAMATGALRLEPAVNGQGLTFTQERPDDAGRIEPITLRAVGSVGVETTIISTAEVEEYSATGLLYTGDNDVLVVFPAISGPVRIEIGYYTRAVPAEEDPGPDGLGWPDEFRQISLYFADAAQAAEGLHLIWNDPGVEGTSGGISSVDSVRVYSLDGAGAGTLRYSKNPGDMDVAGSTQLVWRAPWHDDIVATFRIRASGQTTWQDLTVARISGDFVVDVGVLAPGDWEYEVTYTQNGELRAKDRGIISASGSAVLNVVEPPPGGVYPTEAVAPVTGYYTGDVDFTLVSSATHAIAGTPTPGAPLPMQWSGTNQVDLSWANLGTGTVRVEVDYISAPSYAFNHSGAGGYETTPSFVPGVSSSWSEEYTDGATGVSFTWTDDPANEIGGVSRIERVRVYTLVNGSWALRLDRDVNAVRAGRSLYWGIPDDPEVTTEFRFRAVGSATWTLRDAEDNGESLLIVDLDDLAVGQYEYQIVQKRDDGGGAEAVAYASGGFAVTANARSHNLGVTQYNVIPDSGAQDFGPIAWDGVTLKWSQSPAAGDVVSARARVVGAATWTDLSPVGAGADYTATITVPAGAVVEFEVLYTHSGETTPYLRAGGRLNDQVAVTREHPVLRLTQDQVTHTPRETVDGLLADNGQLSWTTHLQSNEYIFFQITPVGGGDPQSPPVTDTGDGYVADLSGLAAGQYEWEITYVISDTYIVLASARGTVTVAGSPNGAGMILTDTTEYTRTVVTGTNPNIPTRTQVLDRWGNAIASTDASGNTTNYRYNQANQMVESRLPQVQVVDTTGGLIDTRLERPTQESHFDLLGRQVATTDAKGHVNRVAYNAAGNVLEEVAADGGTKTHTYDAFGDLVLSRDQLGYYTRNTYDKTGLLSSVEREVQHGGLGSGDTSQSLLETYYYDYAGRRSYEMNAAGESVYYRYTMEGKLYSRYDNSGETRYLYDFQGNKIAERDANQKFQRWQYDGFGRMTSYSDLGGHTTSYKYDLTGQLVSQSSSIGQRQQYYYDEAGHLSRIVDTGAASRDYSDVVGVNRITEYGYDLEGRRVMERTIIDGRVHQDNFITFDALGRMSRVNDPDYEVTYSYDGVGNRTHINADYYDHIGKGPGNVRTQDLWYTYDEMNRVLKSQGMNFGGVVQVSTQQGTDLTYNLRGERTSATTAGEHLRLTTSTLGGVVFLRNYHRVFNSLFTENYTYDGLGRLVATDEIVGTTSTDLSTGNVTTGTTVVRRSSREYDAASREVLSMSYALDEDDDSAFSLKNTATSTTYDEYGRMYQQITRVNGVMVVRMTFGRAQFLEASVETVTSTVFRKHKLRATFVRAGTSGRSRTAMVVPRNIFSGGSYETYTSLRYLPDRWEGTGWDAVGNLIGYRAEFFKESNGKKLYTTDHEFDYRFGGSYQNVSETATSTGKNHPENGRTIRTYNVNGELIQFTDSQAQKNNRYFANNHEGQALTVINGKFGSPSAGQLSQTRAFDNALTRTGNKVKAQYFFFANGQNIGTFGQLVDEDGRQKANFDVNYTPVSAAYPSSAPAQVVVQEGDTLRGIAARIFGDASLWYLLAEANGLTDPDSPLVAGTQLDVPNKVNSLSNKFDSFKPFDPTLAVGDTTPTQPMPKGGCGVLGLIIIVIVVIVVTILTAGAAAGPAASGAGAAGGAAGGAGAAGAGAAGAGAGAAGAGAAGAGAAAAGAGAATSGIGATFAAGTAVLGGTAGFSAATLGAAVLGGVVGAAVGQGLSIAFGYSDKFDWKAVAIGGISAGVGAGLGAAAQAITNLKTAGAFLSTVGKILNNPAGRAAVQTAFTQAISVGTRLQSSFSWRDVAISAVAAQASAFAGGYTGSKFIGNLTGSAVRAAFNGKIDAASVIADAFGQTVGDGIVEHFSKGYEIAPMKEEEPAAAAESAPQDAGQAEESIDDIMRRLDKSLKELGESIGAGPTRDETREAIATYGGADTTFSVGKEGKQGWWGVAKSQLGAGASDAQIQARTLQLMTANPGKTVLHVGDVVNTAADYSDSTALATYKQMNGVYQANKFADEYFAQQRAASELQFDTSPGLGDQYMSFNGGSVDMLGVVPPNFVNPTRPPEDFTPFDAAAHRNDPAFVDRGEKPILNWMQKASDALYVEQGMFKNGFDYHLYQAENDQNPWYKQAGYWTLATIDTPFATVEEAIRGIANMPSSILGAFPAADRVGENIGIASDSSVEGSDRVVAGLTATKEGASAFVSLLGPFAMFAPRPAPGAFGQTTTRTTTTSVGTGTAVEVETGSQTVTGKQWDDLLAERYGRDKVEWDWPKQDGFVIGAETTGTVQEGQLLVRYGGDRGKYAAPLGTAPQQLALKPGTDLSNINIFRVKGDIPNVRMGPAAPAFDQVGYGQQFLFDRSIQKLLDDQLLERVTKPR